ncbi:MAG: septum formation initiator family protein [Actinomycetes bacterium]|jgi:cell division protein FtsB
MPSTTPTAKAVAKPSLTGRAIALVGVVSLLVVTLAVPVRELIHQRQQIAALQAQNAVVQAQVDDLTLEADRLKDPAYVTSLIRERLHYLLPGEVGYVVLDPTEAPAPASAGAAKPKQPWFTSMWSSIQKVDQAGQPVAPVGPLVLPPDAPK